MLIFLGMVLVLAILVGFSQRRIGHERFLGGEISFVVLIFLVVFLIGRL